MRQPRDLRRAAGVSLAALAAVGLIGAMATTARADTQEWRLATLAPDGSPWMRLNDHLARELADQTDRRITLRYFGGGAQVDERDVVRKIVAGQFDGADLSMVGLAMIEPSVQVLELPRLFASDGELDYVRDKIWPTLVRQFAHRGYVLAEAGEIGATHWYSKTPIRSLDDLRSAKAWLPESPILQRFFRQLNLQGVPLGVPEVQAGLISNRIDAALAAPQTAVALQWSPPARYVTSEPVYRGLAATVIRKDVWDRALSGDQATATKLMKAKGKKLRKQVRRDNERAQTRLTRQGVSTVATSPELISSLDLAASQTWEYLSGKAYSPLDLQTVLRHRDQYRLKRSRPSGTDGKSSL